MNPIGERSCYDEGKRAAECLTMDYHREHGQEVGCRPGAGRGARAGCRCCRPSLTRPPPGPRLEEQSGVWSSQPAADLPPRLGCCCPPPPPPGQVRIVRIFNTYGPRMALDDGRVVSNFVSQVRAAGWRCPPCRRGGWHPPALLLMLCYASPPAWLVPVGMARTMVSMPPAAACRRVRPRRRSRASR